MIPPKKCYVGIYDHYTRRSFARQALFDFFCITFFRLSPPAPPLAPHCRGAEAQKSLGFLYPCFLECDVLLEPERAEGAIGRDSPCESKGSLCLFCRHRRSRRSLLLVLSPGFLIARTPKPIRETSISPWFYSMIP